MYVMLKCNEMISFFLSLSLSLSLDTHTHSYTHTHRYAARNGDLEMVELLLNEGADPTLKNNLGQDVFYFCDAFPGLRGIMQKHARKTKLMKRASVAQKMTLKSTVIVKSHLTKRISTATPILHDMWLISLDTLLELYGSRGKRNVVEVHQELLKRDLIVNWRDGKLSSYDTHAHNT